VRPGPVNNRRLHRRPSNFIPFPLRPSAL
jgi:hypothetical protein